MAEKTRIELKEYFKKGDKPKEGEFADLIDSFVNKQDDNYEVSTEGLEKVTEGENTGWRLAGMDPSFYGDIGENAVDLSVNTYAYDSKGATGKISVAFGKDTHASGVIATAFGYRAEATGSYSTAFGSGTQAKGLSSTAFGSGTRATEIITTAFGVGTLASGYYSTAFGSGSEARGSSSTAFGSNTQAVDSCSTAFGILTQAVGARSTAFGSLTQAIGEISTAFGTDTKANGSYSVAFGSVTQAMGEVSTAFGNNTHAEGDYSTAFGIDTAATGIGATAFGGDTQANGISSTAFGRRTQATGAYSTAFGRETQAHGYACTAFGIESRANSFGETCFGLYTEDIAAASADSIDANDYIMRIGIGTAADKRKDGFRIQKNGAVTANALTPALIDASDDTILVTKEWVKEWANSNFSTDIEGEVTISASGTAVITIPHTIGTKPSVYLVNAVTADAAGILYITADENNVYMHYATAPTGTLSYQVSIKK